MTYRKIGIIIPAHNEEKRIKKTLEVYSNYFKNKSYEDKKKYSILVVINNTQDKTEKIVKKIARETDNVLYLNFKRGGKGYAVTEGFKHFIKKKYDLVGFVDADMSTSPNAFYDLILNLKNYSAIIGNRWSKESKIIKKQPFTRRLASRIFNLIVKLFFFMNYQDTQCGAKLFKIKNLELVVAKIFITQWAFDVNLLYLYKKYGFKVREFPTVWIDRDFSSVSTIKTSIKMFSGVLRLRLIYSPFKRLVEFYDLLPEGLKLNHTLIK